MKLFSLSLVLFLIMAPMVTPEVTIGELPGGIYKYDKNNPPEVWFFPADKARWDGAKITAKDWHMLSNFQKVVFINEYIEYFGQRFYITIKGIDAYSYSISLDNFADECKGGCLKKPMTGFIEELLAQDGILEDRVIVK